MDALPNNSEFYDYKSYANLLANIEKDEDDHFPLQVSIIEQMTHDTLFMRLDFPNKAWIAGLWAGGHVKFHAEINGKHCKRKFTPISPIN